MSTLTDKIAALPPMPPEIERDGAGKLYKTVRYTVYDDGNSADTPYDRDPTFEALAARLELACEALDLALEIAGCDCDFCAKDMAEVRAVFEAVKP